MKLRHGYKSTPASALSGNWRDFDHLLDQMFRRAGGEDNTEGGNATQQQWAAPASLWEEEGCYHLEVEFAGVAPEDMDITTNRGVLTIVADKKKPEGDRNYQHHERRFGRVERTVALPEDVDPDSIEASSSHGVLSVTLAKRAEDQPRRINIQTS